MFTGIVEELGEVVRLEEVSGDSALLTVRGSLVTSDASPGDSISVNGVCLTVVHVDDETFTADVMGETLRRSTLGNLVAGDALNLERAATLSSRLGGHLVQGHVDGIGTILAREPAEQWETVRCSLSAELSRFVVEKGSITIDGTSLTVVDVTPDQFSVGLIPTTLKLTTLGHRRIGDPVNIEVDVIAKYVEKMLRDPR